MLDLDVAGVGHDRRVGCPRRACARRDPLRAADRRQHAPRVARPGPTTSSARTTPPCGSTGCSSTSPRASSSSSRSTSGSRAPCPAARSSGGCSSSPSPAARFTLVQELPRPRTTLEAYVNGVVEVVVRDGAKAEIVNVQRLSLEGLALRLLPRARRARRRARLGRGRLRLREGQGLDPERPRRPRRDLAGHRRVLRRRRPAPRLRHVPAAQRARHDLRLRVQGRAPRLAPRPSGAG